MPDTASRLALTHDGALRALNAAIARALALGVPQCITIVDAAGHALALARMDGAKILSIDTSLAKARTAVSDRAPTGRRPADVELKLALAAGAKHTNLRVGLPIIIAGEIVGGIGVGSGTGEQDVDVARAGLAALAGAETFADTG